MTKRKQSNLYTQENCFSFSHPLFHYLLYLLTRYQLSQSVIYSLTHHELKIHSKLLVGIWVYEQPRHRTALCLDVNAFFPEFLVQGFTFSPCCLKYICTHM